MVNWLWEILNFTLKIVEPAREAVVDSVSGLTQILNAIIALPVQIFAMIFNLTLLFVYPVSAMIDILHGILAYLWWVFAGTINLAIGLPQFALYIWNLFFSGALLPIWGALIFWAILINVAVRLYAFVRHIKTWVPTWGN